MGNSTSSSNSAPCASVKVTTHRSKAHSIASLTGTSDSSTDSAPSSSLSTDQSGPSSGHSSTDDDAAELVYYSTQHESTQPHSCSSDSLSVDLEYFDRRSVDVTTSSFELVAPCPELRYNCSQVRQSLMPQYRSHSVLGLNEQLSTDSASLSTNSSVTNRHYVRQLTTKERFRESNERYGSKDQPGGIRVPVMPLPRSKSFHQILRPTQNGHILASKGTIRGASSTHSKTTTTTTKEPFVSRMKNMFNQKSKDFLSSQKHSELESILLQRLCQSESNLHQRTSSSAAIADNCGDEEPSSAASSALTVSIPRDRCNRLTPKKYSPTTCANSALNQSFGQATYRPVQSPVHFKPPYRPSKDTHSGHHSTSSIVSGGGPGNGNCNLTTGAVATKIQRVKQWRYQNQNHPLPATPEKNVPSRNQSKHDLSPLSKMTAYLSSSTQDMSLDSLLTGDCKKKNKHNTDKKKNCKIKRSVSNFDESAYAARPRELGTPLSAPIVDATVVDNPWKLQKPKYETSKCKTGAPADWNSPYLSFQFLNERITSRLQLPDGCPSKLLLTTSGGDTSPVSDSAYQTSRSDDSKEHADITRLGERLHNKLSCSEANLLNTTAMSSRKAKGSNANRLAKRKSFKKLIGQYLSKNTSSSSHSSQDSLASGSHYGTGTSYFAPFDQNFILKRNTPNAGLGEQRLLQSNMKEYFDNDQSIYERTWRKNKRNPSKASPSQRPSTGNRSNFSTIDRQLEMFENMLNSHSSTKSEHLDDDELVLQKYSSASAMGPMGKSNLSLSELTQHPLKGSFSSFAFPQAQQLQYLQLIGQSDNSLCAKKKKNRSKATNPAHQGETISQKGLYWTPLNDLSSESDDDDDLSLEEEDETSPYDLPEDNLVDIEGEVEEFMEGPQLMANSVKPTPMPRQHVTGRQVESPSSRHQQCTELKSPSRQCSSPSSACSGSLLHLQLPPEPCLFTLSNQLQTLLHNSSRLKKQNYFFY